MLNGAALAGSRVDLIDHAYQSVFRVQRATAIALDQLIGFARAEGLEHELRRRLGAQEESTLLDAVLLDLTRHQEVCLVQRILSLGAVNPVLGAVERVPRFDLQKRGVYALRRLKRRCLRRPTARVGDQDLARTEHDVQGCDDEALLTLADADSGAALCFAARIDVDVNHDTQERQAASPTNCLFCRH